MGLLNLTLGQLLAVFLPLAGALVALYFYDRSRRRATVSTLRFWPTRPAPPVTRRHKKLQQPLSLLLQVLAMLLLLLAVADLRFGVSEGQTQRHVVVLDASSAMGRQSAPGRTWMDEARERALAYLRAVPAGDQVLLIRADGLPAPATGFTASREELREAIRRTEAGWTALNLTAALDLARSSLELALDLDDGQALASSKGAGEIVYIGAGRTAAEETPPRLPSFRAIDVGGPGDDAAIRRFSARRAPDDASRWEVRAEIANESAAPRTVRAGFYFEGRRLGERSVEAPAYGAAEVEFRIRTEQAGRLEARLEIADSLALNDSASLALPASVRRPIEVRTERRAALTALLDAAPALDPRFESAGPASALRLLDRPRAAAPNGAVPTLYFDPAPEASPAPVASTVRNARIVSWNPAHPLGAGLRESDVTLDRASILTAGPDDIVVASVEQGPVVVACARGAERWAVVGFDPLAGPLANRLTTPLLFANIVRWFAPEVFREDDYRAESPGAVEIDVAPAEREQVEVEPLEGAGPAWVWSDGRVRLFSAVPGVTEVRTPYQQTRLAMSLPQAPGARWTPPPDALRGVPPPSSRLSPAGARLWPWLALLAAAILVYDWRRFGRGAGMAEAAAPAASTSFVASAPVEAEQPEAVAR